MVACLAAPPDSYWRPSHQPTTPQSAALPAPTNIMRFGVTPIAVSAVVACGPNASDPRYTGTSIVFLALYYVSLSNGPQSISRPGRTNAYSPARRAMKTASNNMNELDPASTAKPAIMKTG